MILDIILVLLVILVIFIGYKVGFLTTFIKLTSVVSGLVIAILFTKPVANLACSWGVDNGISNNVYSNIVTSDAYQAYIENGEGVDGISGLLTELGIPSFLSGIVANGFMNEVDPETVAHSIADGISYASVCVITFFILLIFSSVLFLILKMVVKGLRKSVGFIRVLDGILGGIFYLLLFVIVIYISLLIISVIMQSLPADSSFVNFMQGQLHLNDNKFGITKYLYENNLLGNILGLFFK